MSLEFYEEWSWPENPAYSQAKSSKIIIGMFRSFNFSSIFQNGGQGGCHTPKMTHFLSAYDVIGHYVTILSDIGNETARIAARSKLHTVYVGEVS